MTRIRPRAVRVPVLLSALAGTSLLGSAPALASTPAKGAPAAAARSAASSGAPSASAEGDLIKWRTVEAGEAEAQKSGKPVLYFLTAEWCGPCHQLRRAVFSDPKLAELVHQKYVPIQVTDQIRETGRNSEDVNEVYRRFQIRGFPTLAVARPRTGPSIVAAGWSGRERTVEFLSQAGGMLAERESAK